jgi:hypothetical protein
MGLDVRVALSNVRKRVLCPESHSEWKHLKFVGAESPFRGSSLSHMLKLQDA